MVKSLDEKVEKTHQNSHFLKCTSYICYFLTDLWKKAKQNCQGMGKDMVLFPGVGAGAGILLSGGALFANSATYW